MAQGPKRYLRDNLVQLIDGIAGVVEVKERPTLDFTGYPAAFVVPAGNESEFQSTTHNLREYIFTVWLFNEIDAPENMEECWDDLMDISDEIINLVDAQESHDSDHALGANLPAPYTLVKVSATPGEDIPDETEKKIATKIVVRLGILVDIDQL